MTFTNYISPFFSHSLATLIECNVSAILEKRPQRSRHTFYPNYFPSGFSIRFISNNSNSKTNYYHRLHVCLFSFSLYTTWNQRITKKKKREKREKSKNCTTEAWKEEHVNSHDAEESDWRAHTQKKRHRMKNEFCSVVDTQRPKCTVVYVTHIV